MAGKKGDHIDYKRQQIEKLFELEYESKNPLSNFFGGSNALSSRKENHLRDVIQKKLFEDY